VSVDPDDITARIVPVPVPEARYTKLRAVADGLAWLHETLSGVLGESGASPDVPPRRAALERFDLGHDGRGLGALQPGPADRDAL
jgi:tricorn protease